MLHNEGKIVCVSCLKSLKDTPEINGKQYSICSTCSEKNKGDSKKQKLAVSQWVNESPASPVVKICSGCQDEFPIVKDAVFKNKDKYHFTHGICRRHLIDFLKKGNIPDSKIDSYLKSKTDNETPDLKNHPELIQKYSQGNFINESLKNKFIRLANIKKVS